MITYERTIVRMQELIIIATFTKRKTIQSVQLKTTLTSIEHEPALRLTALFPQEFQLN